MLAILLALVLVSNNVLADCYNFATMSNMDDFSNVHPILPDERQPPPLPLNFAEAALGGMIPTSVIVLLVALIRILRIYQQRRNRPVEAHRAVKPVETAL